MILAGGLTLTSTCFIIFLEDSLNQICLYFVPLLRMSGITSRLLNYLIWYLFDIQSYVMLLAGSPVVNTNMLNYGLYFECNLYAIGTIMAVTY